MKIVYKVPEELKDYENNPRINEKAIEPVSKSIEKFGFLVPVIIDKNNVIVAGHVRKRAAITLNIKEIPCIYAENLNEEQIKAFRLIENKTSEFADWDIEKMQEELNEIVNIDLSTFCFPDLSESLLVSDEDFLQGTEIVKERKNKEIICPKCGEKIEL